MRSVALKLSVAFTVVSVVGVLVVALVANRLTAAEFGSYVERGWASQEQRAAGQLSDYYVATGGWRGAAPVVASLSRWLGQRLVVVDSSGTVVADSAGQSGRGATLAPSTRSLAVAVADSPVGRVYLLGQTDDCDWGMGANAAGWMGQLGPMGGMGAMGRATDACDLPPAAAVAAATGNALTSAAADSGQLPSSEQRFLEATNRALWLAGGTAVAVALLLGLVISRQITRPLRRLTRAAHTVAVGNFAERVVVGSKDELGGLAEAFNSMARNLEGAEQQRRQLFGDIAHELKTPIAILQANLEAMIDGVVEPSPEKLGSLREETLLLGRLVTDLRDLSLAEAGRLQLHLAPVDLGEIVQSAAAGVEAQAQGSGVRLDVAVAEALPAVRVDPDRIGQVLRNLLSNALRYTPAAGSVRVRVGLEGAGDYPLKQGGYARVSVADTGPGLAAEELTKVFDRFYRVDKSRSREGGGTGLGLAVAKQFVEAHGGRIWAESEPGDGATFHFTLPLAPTASG